MLRKSIFISLVFSSTFSQANFVCRDVFTLDDAKVLYIPNAASFSVAIFKESVDAQALRRFKGPEGSLDLLNKNPTKNKDMAHASIADQILFLTLGISFNDIAGVKGAIDFFRNQDNKLLLKAVRGDWQATQNIYRILAMLSGWVNEAHPTEPAVDLTLRKDLLRFLSLRENESIAAAWARMRENYYSYQGLVKDPLAAGSGSPSKDADGELIIRARELYSKLEYRSLMESQGVGLYLYRKSTTELLELLAIWVRQLHFPDDTAEKYIADLYFIAKNPLVSNSNVQKVKAELHVSLLRYFNKYILAQRLPRSLTDREIFTSTYAEFAKIQLLLRQFDAFHKRQEILLEQALVGIESLNAQVEGLEQRLSWAKQETSYLPPAQAAGWVARFDKYSERLAGLKSQELSHAEWVSRTQALDREHFVIERLLQEWARQKQKLDIEFFTQLNFQWELLLPQKAYKVKGLDYDSVVFNENVIEFFAKNLERGSYFLAAFSKGYVPNQNSSGLRRIPAIHSDFRDIKLLKHGGKVRVVGRLVGRTIHFFSIYDQDHPYVYDEIHRMIQRFTP